MLCTLLLPCTIRNSFCQSFFPPPNRTGNFIKRKCIVKTTGSTGGLLHS
ncbi:hypothetical protein CLOSTMETH_03113 [[Clostridium] methylpentosum DSM 5476]|uniref:Uncharacterized protein n=1 Tax=[Clostridium] methylpentosum DSM 5476 TaxID=537013 RepID=C0EGW9_9FIRM|nr:hypothetical protein CLOSTMETH_03113 [[Clostridium] methylpentosum DSM 5476]